mmetsp:Transcript_42289/g.83008  ORF Transcript_42289/g.83008 Transcript_42289/m.83008 type:complete len:110 (-) Transcript_42289:562-891(-)
MSWLELGKSGGCMATVPLLSCRLGLRVGCFRRVKSKEDEVSVEEEVRVDDSEEPKERGVGCNPDSEAVSKGEKTLWCDAADTSELEDSPGNRDGKAISSKNASKMLIIM